LKGAEDGCGHVLDCPVSPVAPRSVGPMKNGPDGAMPVS